MEAIRVETLTRDPWAYLLDYLSIEDINALRLTHPVRLKGHLEGVYAKQIKQYSNQALVTFLREHGLPETHIGIALWRGEAPFLEAIFKQGAELPPLWLNNQLISVVTQGHVISMMLLNKMGADPNACFQAKNTVLNTTQNIGIVPTNNKYTALQAAAFHGQFGCMRFLIKHKGDPKCLGQAGRTVLHIAVARRYRDIVRFLVEQFPELVSILNSKQQYPLHLAALHYDEVILPMIVEKSKDVVNAQDKDGYTAVHLMVKLADNKCDGLPLLVEAGADLTIRNSLGECAKDLIETESTSESGLGNRGTSVNL